MLCLSEQNGVLVSAWYRLRALAIKSSSMKVIKCHVVNHQLQELCGPQNTAHKKQFKLHEKINFEDIHIYLYRDTVSSCSPRQEQLTAHSNTSQKLQILKKLTVIFYVQTITLPHQITARGQSKHQNVLCRLHQRARLHSETLQVAWSTDHHHHVQHNQVELQSASQPEVHNLAVKH